MPLLLSGLSGLLLAVTGCSGSLVPANVQTAQTGLADQKLQTSDAFLVIAHRGASGYRPEHTLAAYSLAIEQGADFIEPDLVPTADGHLIARHENALAVVALNDADGIKRAADGRPTVVSATTDVAERPEFAHLLQVRHIDGRAVGGWFSEDFTLAQIQTLFARERIPQLRPDNQSYAELRIPSLKQILELLQRPANQHVGMYPELKHPTHFRFGTRAIADQEQAAAIDIDTAALLTQQLAASQFTNPNRLFIQCFEVETLRRLHNSLLPRAGFSAPLVQLLGKLEWQIPDVAHHLKQAETAVNATATADHMTKIYGPLASALTDNSTYDGLLELLPIAATDYVAGVGPRKGDAKRVATFTQELGLELHPYTVRGEAFFLSPLRGALAGSVVGELNELRALGASGVFIDQPDLAVQWRRDRQQTTDARRDR